MNGADRFWRMLRWYPPQWRSRYGEEMVALLEDTHGMGRVSWSDRLSIAKAGSIERLRSAGTVGDSFRPGERARAGSLLVLWAWALFTVAGGIFAKFTDNWDAATAPAGHGLARTSDTVVQVAGTAGVVLVLVAGLVALPALVRLIRQEGKAFVEGRVLAAVGLATVAIALTVGLVGWAHHLSYHNRNGGLWPYEVAFVVWGVSVVAAIGAGTAAASSVARRLVLSSRSLRVLGVLAIVLSITMALIMIAMLTWWAEVAGGAPAFLGNGMLATSNVLPPALLMAGVLMLLGLAVAVTGTLRVGQALRAGDA